MALYWTTPCDCISSYCSWHCNIFINNILMGQRKDFHLDVPEVDSAQQGWGGSFRQQGWVI
jgi:hypothetical protein